MNIWSYPKIFALGHPEVEDLFSEPDKVTVQEKVDGSQFSFGVVGGRLQMRSKGADVYDQAQGGRIGNGGMFEPVVAYLEGIIEDKNILFPQEYVFRCEFLSKPKHNSLTYDRIPLNGLVLYDVEGEGPSRFTARADILTWAVIFGIDAVPTLQISDFSPESIQAALQTVSFLGGQKVEGLVFKRYDLFGRDKKVLMGKYVSEEFKEIHHKAWKEGNPGGGDIVERIAKGLKTPARFNKAVQHLKERGELQMAPQDIGPLLKELKNDLQVETKDEVVKALYEWAWPKISRVATAGFPEWYKERLLERQFDDEKDPDNDSVAEFVQEVYH